MPPEPERKNFATNALWFQAKARWDILGKRWKQMQEEKLLVPAIEKKVEKAKEEKRKEEFEAELKELLSETQAEDADDVEVEDAVENEDAVDYEDDADSDDEQSARDNV